MIRLTLSGLAVGLALSAAAQTATESRAMPANTLLTVTPSVSCHRSDWNWEQALLS